jgi:hypothetical protein
MEETSNLHIRSGDRAKLKEILRPDDMLISGGDIAFAGGALSGWSFDSAKFASYISSLAHLITRIVLSDRLVFLDGQGAEDPPTSFLQPLIERYCKTVQIDDRHPLISAVVDNALKDPLEVFGEDGKELLLQTNVCANRYASWNPPSDRLSAPFLAEYAVAGVIHVPFAPNPFISQPLQVHAKRGRTSAEELLQYVEDLRRERSQALNVHKKLDVYDLQVPAIFGAVLRNSNDPVDLIRVAAQMNAEASAFRSWCRSLDATEAQSPSKYDNHLQAAKQSLSRLAGRLGTTETTRMELSTSVSAFAFKLPSALLGKVVNYLDVDIGFFRPRSYLLHLLSQVEQIQRLAPQLSKIFGHPEKYVKQAADRLSQMAGEQQTMLESGSTID